MASNALALYSKTCESVMMSFGSVSTGRVVSTMTPGGRVSYQPRAAGAAFWDGPLIDAGIRKTMRKMGASSATE